MTKLTKVIKGLEDLVVSIEKNEVYKSTIGEIPSSILGLFPPTMQMRFKSIYADMRINGHTKEKSLNTSSRMVLRGVNRNSVNHLFVEIQKTLLSIRERIMKGEHFSESVENEEFINAEDVPITNKSEIPVAGTIDVDPEPNKEDKACGTDKKDKE